ncbi:MAG: hypothetical protein IJ779_09145 [Ruminococcus sp.]|nr:hypothetical protein [Ruminococcus sp.]
MFWTNFVKTIGKVLLVILLLATIAAFISTAKYSFLKGLGVLVAGTALSFISVSSIMLICEMSENIGAIRKHLTGNTNNAPAQTHISFNELAQNLGVNVPQSPAQSGPAQMQSVSAPQQPSAPQAAPAQPENTQDTQSNTVNLTK